MADKTVDILLKIQTDLAELKQAQQEVKKLDSVSRNLKSALALGGAIGIGILSTQGLARGFMDATTAGVSFTAMVEQQTVAFETLLGTQKAAQARIGELTTFATTTPYAMQEVVDLNRLLQSLTNGELATAEGMRLVGDAAAAAGRNLQETGMWVGRLYAGLQSGTPVGEATMRLLEMGLISGETKRRLDELANQGGRPVNEVFAMMQDTFGKTSGAMEKQSRTLNGLFSTLKDTLVQMTGEALEPTTGAIKEFTQAFLEWAGAVDTLADSERARRSFDEFGSIERLRQAVSEDEIRRELEVQRQRMEAAEAEREAILNRGSKRRSAAGIRAVKTKKAEDFLTDEEQSSLIDIQRRLLMITREQERWTAERIKTTAAANAAKEKESETAAIRAGIEKESSAWLDSNLAKVTEAIHAERLRLMPAEARLALLKEELEFERDRYDQATSGQRQAAEAQAQALQAQAAMLALEGEILEIERDISKEKEKQARETERAAKEAARRTAQIEEDATRDALSARQREISGVRGDYRLNQVAKRNQEIEKLRQQVAEYDQLLDRLKRLRDLQQTPEARELVQGRLGAMQRERDNAAGELAGREAMADPQSMHDQMIASWTELQNRWGTFQQQASSLTFSTLEQSIDGVSAGIMGMINGTQTFGQVFAGIAQQFVAQVIQMTVRMLILKGIMMVLNAIPGGSAVLKTLDIASMLPGYDIGGYTGRGPTNEVAGLVHRGEYVMPAHRVSQIGVGTLEAIKNGRPVAPNVNVQASDPQIIVVDSEAAARRVLESRAGAAQVMRLIDGRLMELGVRG